MDVCAVIEVMNTSDEADCGNGSRTPLALSNDDRIGDRVSVKKEPNVESGQIANCNENELESWQEWEEWEEWR